MTYRHLRRDSYSAMPWRNGGGTTYEIAKEPDTGADFQWRLSLARIDQSGPFSEFRGYRRAIALVSGAGCVLHGAAESSIVLDRPGTIATFSGDAAVSCELLGGPCHDLNLMVRSPPGSIVIFRHLAGERPLVAFQPPQANLALFCLSGAVECVSDGASVTLESHDTLIVSATNAAQWRFRPQGAEHASAIAFAWT